MRPKKHETTGSADLFRARLEQIINMKHELVQLANKIDWEWIDGEIAPRPWWAIGWLPPASGRLPILFGLAPHGWRSRVLDFEPVIDAPGAIRWAEPLRHNAFAAELAGLPEDDRTVALVVLIDYDAGTRRANQFCELALAPLNSEEA
jgi:hypothetical protein